MLGHIVACVVLSGSACTRIHQAVQYQTKFCAPFVLDVRCAPRQRAWQGVRQDLSQLFPELPSWEVGVGVDKIYETVSGCVCVCACARVSVL